ncbi:MAG: NDP-sugar synthase [Myxococcales bacterium]|nr:NDP-sugar synthase [Myxococcales bacterium]
MSFTAMVLAAGYGTRLRPLTDELPKPLVPVGDRSLLAHITGALIAAGAARIVVNAHHLASKLQGAVAELRGAPNPAATDELRFAIAHETRILGTAGGVRNAAALLGEGSIVVVNGDILAELAITTLREAHARDDSLATLAVGPLLAVGEGTVGIGVNGAVVRLRGHSFGVELAGSEFVGAQLLSPDARALLPEEGCLVGDLYLPALQRGERVTACSAASLWCDVGTPGAYLAANRAWLKARDLDAFVADTAEVSPRVSVVDSLIGAAAEITGHGALVNVVVWPGARAHAPLANAIVTIEHTVHVPKAP